LIKQLGHQTNHFSKTTKRPRPSGTKAPHLRGTTLVASPTWDAELAGRSDGDVLIATFG
jgi:hypothetical protein